MFYITAIFHSQQNWNHGNKLILRACACHCHVIKTRKFKGMDTTEGEAGTNLDEEIRQLSTRYKHKGLMPCRVRWPPFFFSDSNFKKRSGNERLTRVLGNHSGVNISVVMDNIYLGGLYCRKSAHKKILVLDTSSLSPRPMHLCWEEVYYYIKKYNVQITIINDAVTIHMKHVDASD